MNNMSELTRKLIMIKTGKYTDTDDLETMHDRLLSLKNLLPTDGSDHKMHKLYKNLSKVLEFANELIDALGETSECIDKVLDD
jgi:hypothetical protein